MGWNSETRYFASLQWQDGGILQESKKTDAEPDAAIEVEVEKIIEVVPKVSVPPYLRGYIKTQRHGENLLRGQPQEIWKLWNNTSEYQNNGREYENNAPEHQIDGRECQADINEGQAQRNFIRDLRVARELLFCPKHG